MRKVPTDQDRSAVGGEHDLRQLSKCPDGNRLQEIHLKKDWRNGEHHGLQQKLAPQEVEPGK